jgi:hypothetical protein
MEAAPKALATSAQCVVTLLSRLGLWASLKTMSLGKMRERGKW